MKRKRRIEITRYSKLIIMRGDDVSDFRNAADFDGAAPDHVAIDLFPDSERGSQPALAENQHDSGASNLNDLRFLSFRRLTRFLPWIRRQRQPP